MRYASIEREPPHSSFEDAEPGDIGRFIAGFIQPVQSQADAEKRSPGAYAFDDRIAKSTLVERIHHLPEMSDSGQHHFRRALQTFRRCKNLVGRADLVQRVLHGTEVPRAVIDDGDHSKPFVDGNSFFSRASFEHAYFIARAKHLNTASILWWLERP